MLQAGSSADHTRTKESLSFHGAHSWPGLWQEPEWPPFRTFWGNMAAAPLGSLQVLQLLKSLLLHQLQETPRSNDSSSLLCMGSGGSEAHLSREKFLSSLRTWWCLRHHQGALGLLGTRGQGKGQPQSVEASGPGAAPLLQQPPPAGPQHRSGRLCWLI